MTLDPEVVEHEARHAAMAILSGIEVSRIDAVGGQNFRGQLRYFKGDDDQRVAQVKTLLVAGDVAPGFPPNDNVADNHDLVHLRRLIDELRLDASRYYRLKAETEQLTGTPEFKSLRDRIADALIGNDGYLDERTLQAIVERWRWDRAGG